MLKKIILRKSTQLFLHSLFWVAVLLFYTAYFGFDSKDFNYTLSFSLFLMPITIATTYVFSYKIIPAYLIPKRYFLFALYSLYTIIISAYLIVLSVFYGLIYLANFRLETMAPLTRSLLFVTVSVYLVVMIVSAFKLLKINLSHTAETKKLETKILETQLKLKEQELNYLKMQIHPHFLFNTLNTLYGFALKKADETPEMILKLSNLLDYLLYKIDKPFVLLSHDIDHINDYIALEKMRFNNTLAINFTTTNCTEDLKIAPMLLLPFIENSFKHGAIKNQQLTINIDLTCQGNTLDFRIENSSTGANMNPNGIGLENIKKRLALIYPENYSLEILNNPDIFKVHLHINLQ